MNAILNENSSPLNHAVERLIAEHGFRAVTGALMVRLVQRPRAVGLPKAGLLNDHLRRDIGLPPVLQSPVPPFPRLP
ncbi:hypothetical protein [Tabrizicola sp.]|uniref:hypothetical protein n=1 Tax=Tabrizicola sp. TaxID=2005166 RepID=UPI003F3B639B